MVVRHFYNGALVGLSSDTKPTRPAGYLFYSTDTGDWQVSDGTYWWLSSKGAFSSFKDGWHISSSSPAAGYGTLNSLSQPATVGTQAYSHDANGRYARMRSLAVSGNRGGLRAAAIATGLPDNNLRMRLRIAPQAVLAVKYFMGFSNQTTEIGGDDLLNALQGFFIGFSSTINATNFLCLHNNGSGATVVDDTGVAMTLAAVRDIRLVCDAPNARWSYSLDGGVTYTHVTTEIPLTGVINYHTPHVVVETSEAALKDLHIYSWFMQSDK